MSSCLTLSAEADVATSEGQVVLPLAPLEGEARHLHLDARGAVRRGQHLPAAGLAGPAAAAVSARRR